jgi:hypothetical protein
LADAVPELALKSYPTPTSGVKNVDGTLALPDVPNEEVPWPGPQMLWVPVEKARLEE